MPVLLQKKKHSHKCILSCIIALSTQIWIISNGNTRNKNAIEILNNSLLTFQLNDLIRRLAVDATRRQNRINNSTSLVIHFARLLLILHSLIIAWWLIVMTQYRPALLSGLAPRGGIPGSCPPNDCLGPPNENCTPLQVRTVPRRN